MSANAAASAALAGWRGQGTEQLSLVYARGPLLRRPRSSRCGLFRRAGYRSVHRLGFVRHVCASSSCSALCHLLDVRDMQLPKLDIQTALPSLPSLVITVLRSFVFVCFAVRPASLAGRRASAQPGEHGLSLCFSCVLSRIAGVCAGGPACFRHECLRGLICPERRGQFHRSSFSSRRAWVGCWSGGGSRPCLSTYGP